MSEKLFYMRSYSMSLGVNVNAADISIGERAVDGLSLTENSKNISFGRRAGISSRYGIWPLPGHSTTEKHSDITAGEFDTKEIFGLMGTEATITQPTNGALLLDKRETIFGAIKIQLPMGGTKDPSGVKLNPICYWVVSRDADSADASFKELCLSPSVSLLNSIETIDSKLEAGLGFAGSRPTRPSVTGTANEANRSFKSIDRMHTNDLETLKTYEDVKSSMYLKWAHVQSRIDTNIKEFIGWNSAANYSVAASSADPGLEPYPMMFGALGAPYWCDLKDKKLDMSIKVMQGGYAHNQFVTLQQWDALTKLDVRNTNYLFPGKNKNRSANFGSNTESLLNHGPDVVWTDNGGAYITASKLVYCEIDDKPITVPVDIIAFVVESKPKVVLFNSLIRDSTNHLTAPDSLSRSEQGNDFQQWIDPTDTLWKPKSYNTINSASAARYSEGNGAIEKQTSWIFFPTFAAGVNSSGVIADRGVLRSQTTYEISYSIYNSLTGKESNVGEPAKIYTGTISNGGLGIHNNFARPKGFDAGNSTYKFSFFPGLADMFPDVEVSGLEKIPVNHLHFKVYYREVGSFEWLFSGQLSFAKVFFKPDQDIFYVGSGDQVGVVGGQPGGFNDYSDLPTDEYIDVKGFGDRLFWLSKKNLRYSLTNDKLSYPATNYYPSPDGEFKGMIEHYFAGQSKQDGRLVVFGSEGIYDGSFTGNLQLEQVRVSSTAQPQAVPKDGSDFILKRRGSETAFSGRTAVVAEGILYFFGPTGIYRDSGVSIPDRISQSLEPELLSNYDKSKTDEFFSYFNKKSREIIFFYRPKNISNGYLTKAWVYSLRVNAFTLYSYKIKIDWAQDFDWTDFQSQHEAGGVRTIIGMTEAATISRVGFHDDDCPGGDMIAGKEFLCKELIKDGLNFITLVFGDGFSTSVQAAISIGDQIGIQGSELYGQMSEGIDGLYTVTSISADRLQILLDSTRYAAIVAQTFTPSQNFPIFVDGQHNIDATIDSEYLCPVTMDRWIEARYLHLLFQPVPEHVGDAIPELITTWRMNHEIGSNSDTKTLPLTKLESGETTTQIYTDLLNSAMTTSGQAIKYTMKYNQLFDRYTLFTMTTQYRDKGTGEIKYYQRENG